MYSSTIVPRREKHHAEENRYEGASRFDMIRYRVFSLRKSTRPIDPSTFRRVESETMSG